VATNADAPALPFWLWPQRWARLLGFFGFAAGVGLEVELLVNAAANGVLFTLGAMFLFMPLVWLFARGALLHVRVTSDGVRVFNTLHTYDLQWDDIESIEAINQEGGIGGYARINKTDGEQITLAVSNFGIRGDPTSALRIATPLGKALDRQRALDGEAPLSTTTDQPLPT
jgi:hypothetical protein